MKIKFLVFVFLFFSCSNYSKVENNNQKNDKLHAFYNEMFEKYGVEFWHQLGDLQSKSPRLSLNFRHYSVHTPESSAYLVNNLRNDFIRTFELENRKDDFVIHVYFLRNKSEDILSATCLRDNYSLCYEDKEKMTIVTYKDFFVAPGRSLQDCEKIVEVR